jgi:hypothetical protein
MTHKLHVLALAAAGVLVASAGGYAAQADNLSNPLWRSVAAVMGPSPSLGSSSEQRDVIEPPSSIDPGMTLDPPQTGRMRIIQPPASAPSGRPILPR